jgi:hypothetical protein
MHNREYLLAGGILLVLALGVTTLLRFAPGDVISKFRRVRIGMSVETVERLLGRGRPVDAATVPVDYEADRYYQWLVNPADGPRSRVVFVGFKNGTVCTMYLFDPAGRVPWRFSCVRYGPPTTEGSAQQQSTESGEQRLGDR